MSKEYYMCTTCDATPKEVVEDTVAEINHMLQAEGINVHITQYESDDTGGYDYKTEFYVSELAKKSAKTNPSLPFKLTGDIMKERDVDKLFVILTALLLATIFLF